MTVRMTLSVAVIMMIVFHMRYMDEDGAVTQSRNSNARSRNDVRSRKNAGYFSLFIL